MHRSRPTTVLDYLYSPETLTADAIFAEITHLRRYGAEVNEIATQLGRPLHKLRHLATRHGRTDITELLRTEQ